MKNFTQKFIGLLLLVFTISFTVNAQDNYSLSFDGDNDYIELPIIQDYIDPISDLSFSFKFRSNYQDSTVIWDNCLFSISDINHPTNENIFRITITYSGDIWYEFVNNTVIDGTIEVGGVGCNDNQWHNLTVVNERVASPITYFYLDGVQITSIPNVKIVFDDSDIFLIGAEFDCNASCNEHSASDFFAGDISDFHFWNTSLSEDQINSFSQCPTLGDENGLIAYLNFNEGSGDTVYDISGNGNHGILHGAQFSEDVPEQNCIEGCTDSLAENYNPEAFLDNETCEYIQGCTEPNAGNYNQLATQNNGSCISQEEFTIDSLQQALAVFQTVEEEQDYSMSFDGVDDYLEIANNPSIQVGNQFSISFDLNIGLLTPGRIIEKGESGFGWGYGFVLENANIINFYLTGTLGQGEYFSVQSSPLLPDTWYRVTGVFSDNNYARIYIDGQLIQEVTSFNNNHQYQANSSSLKFGNRLNWGGVPYFFPFEGSIDNVQFWNTVLDSTQIQSYMKCPPAGTEEGLTGYWDFDEGLGDTVFDITGSGNHGVIYGAEFSEDVPESFNGCTDENALNFDTEALCDNGSCVYGDNLVSNLEEELSVFETIEEEQDYSMSFDGEDDYVKIENILSHSLEEFTISTNVKLRNYDNEGRIISFGDDNQIVLMITNNNYSPSVIRYIINDDEFDYQLDSIFYDVWHNISVTFDGQNMSLYIDYIKVQELNTNTSIDTVGVRDGIYIGKRFPNNDPEFLNCLINDIIILDRALMDNEFQQLRCEYSESEISVIANWNFNEGSVDTVYDLSGNGNHGVIYGSEFSQDVPLDYNGCTDTNALNFDAEALCDNGSCVFADDVLSNLEESFNQTVSGLNNIIDEATSSLSSLQQALETWDTKIDLSAGWNMFGYGCPSPINVADGLSNHAESIIITKDNSGNVYMPEFGFNGIGDFTPGFGYQLKLTDAIEGFSLCDWYVNDIPQDNIVYLQEEVENLNDSLSVINSQIGCTDSLACNFDVSNLYHDGSCEYPTQGYDCDGNINIQIGDEAFGGIVFYVDETGQSGLVAAVEDLALGSNWIQNIGYGYEWGCYGESVNGADGSSLGSGYQNTLDIINHNCQTESGSVTAAQACFNYSYDQYFDWYLPSIDELTMMFNSIGNTGGFCLEHPCNNEHYWSSTENNSSQAKMVNFVYDGDNLVDRKNFQHIVRPIRSF